MWDSPWGAPRYVKGHRQKNGGVHRHTQELLHPPTTLLIKGLTLVFY